MHEEGEGGGGVKKINLYQGIRIQAKLFLAFLSRKQGWLKTNPKSEMILISFRFSNLVDNVAHFGQHYRWSGMAGSLWRRLFGKKVDQHSLGKKLPPSFGSEQGERGGRGSGSIAPQELRACAPITIVPPDLPPSVTRGIRWRGGHRNCQIATIREFGGIFSLGCH